MRSWIVMLVCALGGCAQPALLSCPPGAAACADGCVDLMTTATDCGACGHVCPGGDVCDLGQCVAGNQGACDVNHGGCSADAQCTPLAGGGAACACNPGFWGPGQTCTACTMCDATHFAAQPCTPASDTVCMACSPACGTGDFEAQPCTPFGDRVCATCTVCGGTTYEAAPCGATTDTVCATCSTCGTGSYQTAPCSAGQDTQCAPCDTGCATCAGPGACSACLPGFMLMGGACIPTCGNGVLDPGEQCDDGNPLAGDGCSPTCTVEAGFYCYGNPGGPTRCVAGSCATDPLTALPLGGAFALDGTGTASAMGLHLTQRSSIHTTADLIYPIMIEADVIYSAPDLTFVGARGAGLRVAADANEPTDSLRARLTSATVELDAGALVSASQPTPFTVQNGVPYHVRWYDDGSTATLEWIDETNPANATTLATSSAFHGGGDKAFLGGGDMAGLTVANVRACGGPPLPITTGLAARYSAMTAWTAVQDDVGAMTSWIDVSGNGRDLATNVTKPIYRAGLVLGHGGVDFGGAAGLVTAPFALTTDVTVFAVYVHNVPAQWGAIAHHGSRDNDWSMEQSGDPSPDVMHWQTNNDNVNEDLTLAQGHTYVLTGRFSGLDRYFSASTFDGAPPATATITDASHTITAGTKAMYVGTSDLGEASNAYLGELVYYDRALSDNERDQVIDYLRRVWRP